MDIKTLYDTAGIGSHERFAYWREAVCESFVELGCEAENRSDFSGSLEIARYSRLHLSRVSGMAHSVHRRQRDIRAATEEYFLLSLQTRETSRITQFGNSALLRPGDMALYDSTSPYQLDLHNGFAKTVVQLPKARLLSRLPNAQFVAGHRIDGQTGLGKLVRENILSFARHAGDANPTLQAMVQETLIDLIATGLASSIGEAAKLSSPEQHVLLRAKAWVRNHLGDPELDRNAVAAAMGVSVRRLNTIFAKDGNSISEHIRIQRLSSVASELSDSRFTGLSISEIAMRNGFSNLQHFSNLFKSHHGVTPKAWRHSERGV